MKLTYVTPITGIHQQVVSMVMCQSGYFETTPIGDIDSNW